MKHILKIWNHALFTGSIMFIFSTAFRSGKELAAYVLLTASLGAICYVARWRIKTLVSFVISHLILALSIFVISAILSLAGWYSIIWIVAVLSSAIMRLFPQVEYMDAPNYFYVCVEVVIYLLIDVLGGVAVLRTISLAIVIVLFLLHLLHDNMERMEEFLETRSIAMELEEAKMKRVNLRFSLIYTAAMGVLLMLISLVRAEGFMAQIKRVIRAFLRFLLNVFFSSEGEQQEYIEEEDAVVPPSIEQPLETPEPSKFNQILGQILQVLMLLVVAFIIVVGLIRLIKFIVKNFYNRGGRAEEEEVRESLLKREHVSKKRMEGFFEQLEQTPAKRVRRIYKRRMKRFQKQKKLSFRYLVPEEQVDLLKEEGVSEESREDIQLLYEKARYSTEDVTDKEVGRFRSML